MYASAHSRQCSEKSNEVRYKFLQDIRDKEKRRPGEEGYDPNTLHIPKEYESRFTEFEKQYWEVRVFSPLSCLIRLSFRPAVPPLTPTTTTRKIDVNLTRRPPHIPHPQIKKEHWDTIVFFKKGKHLSLASGLTCGGAKQPR